jgi:hypothetical protein
MKIEIEKATRQEALQFQVGYRNPIESIAHAFVALNPKALKVINQHIKSHKGYARAGPLCVPDHDHFNSKEPCRFCKFEIRSK